MLPIGYGGTFIALLSFPLMKGPLIDRAAVERLPIFFLTPSPCMPCCSRSLSFSLACASPALPSLIPFLNICSMLSSSGSSGSGSGTALAFGNYKFELDASI